MLCLNGALALPHDPLVPADSFKLLLLPPLSMLLSPEPARIGAFPISISIILGVIYLFLSLFIIKFVLDFYYCSDSNLRWSKLSTSPSACSRGTACCR